MKFFIDTANLDEIKEAASLGVLDGVTTNPTLLSREKDRGDFKTILKEICEVVNGPVDSQKHCNQGAHHQRGDKGDENLVL
jgi:transaldolase